jgi:hypothetical protein
MGPADEVVDPACLSMAIAAQPEEALGRQGCADRTKSYTTAGGYFLPNDQVVSWGKVE